MSSNKIIDVEILSVPGWASAETTRVLVEQIAVEENIDILIREQLVHSMDLARELQFPGSPTVRIAGMDVESPGMMEASYGMGWRLYPDEAGRFRKQLPPEIVREAFQRAKLGDRGVAALRNLSSGSEKSFADK